MEEVILVNEKDEVIGRMEKMDAHKTGVLHRAFSIFIFNDRQEMLLQQRSLNKYHSGGLWTNACCSHPRPGENTLQAAQRRLKEEMGFDTILREVFDFTYRATFDNGLTEWEFDHVFVGYYDGVLHPNKEEVESYTFYSMDTIQEMLTKQPEVFTVWFQIAFSKILSWWQANN